VSSSNYGSILKATSYLGGASVLNVAIGLARSKAGAVFLGPEGVGLVNIFFNLIHLIRTGFSLGIGGSSMRLISQAKGTGLDTRQGELLYIVRWLYALLGLVALIFCWLAAPWISQLTFGSQAFSSSIRWLALNLPFVIFVPYFTGLLALYGMMGQLAKNSLFSVFWGVAFSIAFYWGFGPDGILPAILATSICSFLVAWWYGRKVPVSISPSSLSGFFITSLSLIPLGLALVWNDFLTWVLIVFKSGFIARELGLEANGIYTAAWGLSALFVNMILGALGTEFYPRLCSVAHDPVKVKSCLNEQIEVSVLLAYPGLLATIFLSKLLVIIVFSSAFLPAADLLIWLTVDNYFRIITWPMPFVLLACNKTKVYAAFQTFNQLFGLGVFLFAVPIGGLDLLVVLSAFLGIFTNGALYMVVYFYCGYRPGNKFLFVLCLGAVVCILSVFSMQNLPTILGHAVSGSIAFIAFVICLRMLLIRTKNHPHFQLVSSSGSFQAKAIALCYRILLVNP
jgi:antigen flippase